jgi:putative transposase
MIGLEDRQLLAREIDSARRAGARLRRACEVAGIDVRTLQRWKAHHGFVTGDARPGASRPLPGHALLLLREEESRSGGDLPTLAR